MRKTPLSRTERAVAKNEAELTAIAKSAELMVVGRERILDDLEGFRQVSILDFFEEDDRTGRIKLKDLAELKELPRHAQRWLKKIQIRDTIDGQVTTVEGLDVLQVLEKAGNSLGMWKNAAPTSVTNIQYIARLPAETKTVEEWKEQATKTLHK